MHRQFPRARFGVVRVTLRADGDVVSVNEQSSLIGVGGIVENVNVRGIDLDVVSGDDHVIMGSDRIVRRDGQYGMRPFFRRVVADFNVVVEYGDVGGGRDRAAVEDDQFSIADRQTSSFGDEVALVADESGNVIESRLVYLSDSVGII